MESMACGEVHSNLDGTAERQHALLPLPRPWPASIRRSVGGRSPVWMLADVKRKVMIDRATKQGQEDKHLSGFPFSKAARGLSERSARPGEQTSPEEIHPQSRCPVAICARDGRKHCQQNHLNPQISRTISGRGKRFGGIQRDGKQNTQSWRRDDLTEPRQAEESACSRAGPEAGEIEQVGSPRGAQAPN